MSYMVFKHLVAHLKTFRGTLVRRGTLVEICYFGLTFYKYAPKNP